MAACNEGRSTVSHEMNVADRIAPQVCHDIPRLLQQFEPIGENCDFGVVQRAVGIEPFGLFRFAACEAADLPHLLRARFQPLGEPGDLWLEEVGPEREFWVKSRHCSFAAHSNRYAGRDDAEVVLAGQIESTRYLKARLLRDLAKGRRILVYKGAADGASIRAIAAELRAYGPNCLLWVRVADAAQRPGSVERLSEGLLQGFVSRYGTYEGDPSLPVEEWLAVCGNAYRLWRKTDPPTAPLHNLIAEADAARTCYWFTHPAAATRVLAAAAPLGARAFEHRLQGSATSAVYRALLPIPAGGRCALSAWIRVPEGFSGRQIAMLIGDSSVIAMWTADLKSRECWQRIWMSGQLPPERRSIACDVIAEGAAGDVFHSAGWCLERGSRPLGYRLPLSQ